MAVVCSSIVYIYIYMGEFPKIWGTLFGVLIIRILLFEYYTRVSYFRKLPKDAGLQGKPN